VSAGRDLDGSARQSKLYAAAVEAHGRALDRLAAGYEADPAKRLDLRQEIHLQLWRSLARFDGGCSLATWTFRVAHNTAASYIRRERRLNAGLVGLEEVERTGRSDTATPDIDRERALLRLMRVIHQLKPLDRQIIICYLEEMDTAAIAEVTGLSRANVAMKIHRIKSVVSGRLHGEEQTHVG
jgi:RNA polymerase sigma-70 factor (ECF subfamily)